MPDRRPRSVPRASGAEASRAEAGARVVTKDVVAQLTRELAQATRTGGRHPARREGGEVASTTPTGIEDGVTGSPWAKSA